MLGSINGVNGATANVNVGIGTTTPNGRFELGVDEGRKPGTSTWTVTSDQRLKNVTGTYSKGLSDIVKLNPVTYRYKNNGKRTFDPEVLQTEYAGFLAQEVQTIFPETVGTDRDGFLNFNIHSILIASVNALKELNNSKIDLENKAKALESENANLKAKLDQQQKQIDTILQRLSNLENK
ncbi:tail fiber domain-containing protein [Flavobacterium aurantiibacter]|uniref:tail fiber domain-containing protein n=1 Tax=Flavobacterium aurantiibacter TaxID=2023067 RepID=UPI0013FD25F8|nr:tail fiber domain-containing protein [Flavobacterium aurantiibacter]